MNAFNNPEKRLLSAQARWLDCDFEEGSSIDSTITDLKDRLSEDAAQPTGAALLRQQRISGTTATVTRLTDPEKEKYKEFLDTAEFVKNNASALKEKFNRAKETKEAVENVSFTPVTNPGTGEVRYVVSIPDGSLLRSENLYSCLLSLAPVITELTIEKLGYESAGKPFLHFMKLCPRFALLEKLCIKGSFAEDVKDREKKGFSRQYESAIRSDDDRLGNLRGSGIPSNAKGFFFRAISLIPHLKTFEMYCVGEDGSPEDTKTQLDDPREIWAAVKPLESVRLPSCTEETYAKLFDYLTRESGPFKKMELCTRCFGDMMRTPGLPQKLYQLLASKKAHVKWFGDLTIGTKAVEAYTISGRSDRNIAALESPEKEEEVIGIVKKRKVNRKNLRDWVSDNFSDNFVNHLDAYVNLCAVHSNAFTQKLIEYNAEELNPVYVAAQRLVNLRPKGKEEKKAADVTVNDPLLEIVRAYPTIEKGVLLFSRKVPVDGSVLKKFTIPALLGLVLCERINGENPVFLGVEDGEAETKEIPGENGTKKTVAEKGKFEHEFMWRFPSYASSFWAEKSFGVTVESSDYQKLSSDKKDDLMQKAIMASDDVPAKLSGCKSISLNMDPATLRNFLKSLCAGCTPLYWHYFVSNARTGKMEVYTTASGDQCKLFDIFAEVVKAQPTHEKLYEAFEKLRSANQALFKVKQELDELKTQAKEDLSDGSVEGKISKKEKEVEAVERKYNALKTEMDTYATDLEAVRDFMNKNLSYVKGVYEKLREEKAKLSMVRRWLSGGRTIRYEDIANPAHNFADSFGKPSGNTWKVKMPSFAGIDGSDAASVNVDKVAEFVKSGKLPVRSDNGLYVVLTAKAIPGAGGVPGARAGAPGGSGMKKSAMVIQWGLNRKIKYRNVNTKALSTGMPLPNTVRVKMPDPKFRSINGRDVTEPNFLEDVASLVNRGALIPEPELNNKNRVTGAFVVLDTEPMTP